MITFKTAKVKPERGPMFSDVAENQFFVDREGCLCQKYDDSQYCIIADKEGEPYSDTFTSVPPDRAIKKILPHVTKINFPAE